MITAILPGSYDPVTNGHLAVIKRAAELYEHVTVLLTPNSAKTYLFSEENRLALLRDAVKDLKNVSVEAHHGYLIDYAPTHRPCVLIKGVRNTEDYVYEAEMAVYNRELSLRKYGYPLETLLMQSDPAVSAISSTLVRTVLATEADLEGLVPNPPLLKTLLASHNA